MSNQQPKRERKYQIDHHSVKIYELIHQQIHHLNSLIEHYSVDFVFSLTILDIWNDISDILVPEETMRYP